MARDVNATAGTRHRVGTLDEFPPGQMRIFEIEGRSVGVVNAGDEFFAVLNICPHELAPVCEGALSGTVIPSAPGQPVYGRENRILRCPWHGYEYDLGDGGRAAFTDFPGRLRLFPVTIQAGEVYVETAAPRG
jgi:3-phenylpropionate/trans-cinnamate dioxygenase ferredoxin subunit